MELIPEVKVYLEMLVAVSPKNVFGYFQEMDV